MPFVEKKRVADISAKLPKNANYKKAFCSAVVSRRLLTGFFEKPVFDIY